MAKKGVEKRGRSLENIGKKTSKRKERKDVKKTAKEERLAQECLDIVGVIVVAIDTNRKVTLINRKGCEVLGWREEEILGKDWIDNFIPERLRKEAGDVFEGLMKGEIEPLKYHQNPVLTKSGEERIIAWHNATLKDKEGRIVATLSSGEDITERKKAEEALQDSEEKYRTLVEQSREGIVIAIGPSPKLVFANSSFARIVGYTIRELLAMSPQQLYGLVHPEDRGMFFERFAERLAGKQPPSYYEFRGITKDKRTIWLEISSTLIYHKGKPAVQAAFTDITERRRVEEAILLAKKRLEFLMSSASAAIYTSKAEYNYPTTFISDSVIQMTGYEPEEFIKNPDFWFEHIHQEDRPIVGLEVPKLFERDLHAYEYRFLCKDGDYIWVRDEMKLIRDEKGNPLEIIGFWSNITERKKTEEALQKSAAEWRTTFDATTDGVCLLDSQQRIQRCNKAMPQLLGKDMSEMVGKQCWEIVHGTSKPIPECPILRMQKTLQRESMELSIDDRQFEVTVDPILDESGSLFGAVHIVRDITERKKSEDALMKSEERFREAQVLGRIGNWEFDLATDKIEWSDETYELYERDKALGPPSVEEEALYYPPEEVARLREFTRLATEKGEEFRYDLTAKLPSGKTVFFNATMRPVRNEEGRIVRLFGTVQDITERKRYQAKLAAILEFSLKMGSTFDIKEIADILLDASEKVLRYRNCALELVDKERQELYAFARRGFPEEAPFFRLPLDSERGLVIACVREGRVIYAPDVRKDERYYEEIETTLSNLCVPLEAGEEVIGVLNMESPRLDEFTEEDISLAQTLASSAAIAIENARLYEQIRQSNLQLEFVTDLMSHDLANINQVALGNIEMLLESELSEKNEKHLVASINAMRRSGRLVKNARILRKMLESEEEKEEIELSTLIERAIQNFKEYPGKNVRVEYEARPAGRILADANLCFALENIVDNAIRFSPATEAKVAVDVFEEKDFFKIEIKDWGKGISDALKEEIFDRFERLKKGVMGTGLGLYATKRIIEKHSGKIGVSDNPEGGSIFCVKLPRL